MALAHTAPIQCQQEFAMTTKSLVRAAASDTEKVLEKKWGKTLIAAGFTALPNVV